MSRAERHAGLRSDTLAHRQLLFWFGLIYVSTGASYLFDSDKFSLSILLVGGLVLLTATWRYLISGLSLWSRTWLAVIAVIPLIGVVTMLLNHWWLAERASALKIPTAIFGPDLDALNEPPR